MSITVSSMERDYFDPEALDLFYRFLAERQSVYARRVKGEPWPWSQDPVLQTEFITNVYRRQDPGTVYLVDDILSQEHVDEADIVFNVMLYRLMGSVPSTHRHLGFQVIDQFDPETFRARLGELPDEHRIFGDAYRVASYHQEGSRDKVTNVASTFAYLAGGMVETMRRIDAARSVVEVYKVFEAMKGFGEFLSHQIVVDLLYPNAEGLTIVPYGENQFAKAGPGARKGIWDLMNADEYRPANMLIVMEWLQAHQQDEFDRIGVLFPWRLDGMGDPVEMSLCDIQAALCEFHKYFRLWNGDRKAQVRKYEGQPGRELTSPWGLHEDAVRAACERLEPWTYQKVISSPEEAASAIEEPSGASSEVLDDQDGAKEPGEPVEAVLEVHEVRAGTMAASSMAEGTLLNTELTPGVILNITINVYPPRSTEGG
jgi:hypothetical protein